MSLLPQQSCISPGKYFFVEGNGQLLNLSSLNVTNISAGTENVSSLFANDISTGVAFIHDCETSTLFAITLQLDNQILTANATDLLLNGVPIATVDNISSLADWSFFPAVSTVLFEGNNLYSVGMATMSSLSSINLYATNAMINNLIAYNILAISSYVSTISSLSMGTEELLVSSINAIDLSSNLISVVGNMDISGVLFAPQIVNPAASSTVTVSSLEISSINGFPISYYSPGSVSTVSTYEVLSASSFTVSSINGGAFAPVSNWANYAAVADVNMNSKTLYSVPVIRNDNSDIKIYSKDDNINISSPNGVINAYCESMNITANEGANITTNATVNITAVNGFKGEINLTADTGYLSNGGVVNVLAKGGVTPLGVAYGGEVNITATTGTFTSLAFTSAVNLNAAGVNSYAGATAPIGSLAGFNFVHGDAGANITAGLPPIFSDPLCVYIRGNNGILMDSATYMKGPLRPYSDSLQNPVDLYIEAYSNLISKGYIQLRGVSTMTFDTGVANTAIVGLDNLTFSSFRGELVNVSSINGQPITYYEPGGVSTVSSFNDLFASTLFVPGSYGATTGIIDIGFTDGLSGGMINFNTIQSGSTYHSLSEHHPPAGGGSLMLTITDSSLVYSNLALNGLYFGNGAVSSAPNGRIVAGAGGLELALVSSINGQPISYYIPVTASSFNDLYASTLQVSTISTNNISTQGIITSSINVSARGAFNNLTYNSASGSILYSNVVSTLLCETSSVTATGVRTAGLSTNLIVGTAIDMFGIPGYNDGLIIQASTLSFTSTPLIVHNGNYNGSTASFFQARIRDVVASSMSASSLLLNSGVYSSIVVPQAGPVPGTGTSSCLFVNTDLNLGNNDLYAQQIRLGRGQLDNFAELVMYGNDGTFKVILAGSADRTLRVSNNTSTPSTVGYLLDTFMNPPFFSTINASTAMMAYFPSTISNTIGVSTIAYVPPKALIGAFQSQSTQTMVANTPIELWHEITDVSIGITTSTNAIVIPVAGNYEINTSIQFSKTGGSGLCDFWFRKNGVDIPASGSQVYLPNAGNGQTLGNVSLIASFSANDKLQVVVASPDTGVSATFFNSTVTTPYTRPSIPAVITTIKNIGW